MSQRTTKWTTTSLEHDLSHSLSREFRIFPLVVIIFHLITRACSWLFPRGLRKLKKQTYGSNYLCFEWKDVCSSDAYYHRKCLLRSLYIHQVASVEDSRKQRRLHLTEVWSRFIFQVLIFQAGISVKRVGLEKPTLGVAWIVFRLAMPATRPDLPILEVSIVIVELVLHPNPVVHSN